MRCPQTIEVGAYVLGALVPAERDAFERHLGECAICREEVAELAVLPGLLGRIDFETARAIAQEGEDSAALFPVGWAGPTAAPPETARPTQDADLPPRLRAVPPLPSSVSGGASAAAGSADGKVVPLLAAVDKRRQREKRRRRLMTTVVAAAAACLALVIGLGIPRFTGDPGPAYAAMTATAEGLPIVADLALEPSPKGTRVIMRCEYTADGPRRSYSLVMVPKVGTETQELSDWNAGPGEKFEMTAESTMRQRDIDRVEIRGAEGRVLLVYRL